MSPPARVAMPAKLPDFRFALLAHPTVQAIRFAAKVVLAWFIAPEAFGQVVLIGLLLHGIGHAAILGLDEALVVAPSVDAPRWRHWRRLHHLTGAAGGFLLLAVVLPLTALLDAPLLLPLALAAAPGAWLANQGVLPAALLVRHGRYRDLFRLDVTGVLAGSAVVAGGAAAGLGPWSLLLGWHANAAVQWAVAARATTPLRPSGEGTAAGDDEKRLLAFGRHCTVAAVAGFFAGNLDRLLVGTALGQAALGVYELAAHTAFAALLYAGNLAERCLLPMLCAGPDENGRRLFLDALEFSLLSLLPLHLLLAALSAPVVAVLFPPQYAGAAAPLALLALAGGARCVDLVATSGLKARARGGTVSALGAFKLVLLAAGVACALPYGIEAVAAAVAVTAAAGAVASVTAASRGLELPARTLARPVPCLLLFSVALWAVARLVGDELEAAPLLHIIAVGGIATAGWFVVRLLLDRQGLRRDLLGLRSGPAS